jgi:hypothetical protein
MKEYRLKELLPLNDIEITEDCDLIFNSQLKRGFFAKKGDAIGEIRKCEKIGKYPSDQLVFTDFQLIAPDDAVYDFTILIGIVKPIFTFSYKKIMDDDIVFCKSYNDFQENAEDIIRNYCDYIISDDIFNIGKVIIWNHHIPTLKGGGEFLKRDAFQLRFFPVDKMPDLRGAIPLLGLENAPFVRIDNAKEQFVFQYHNKKFSMHKFVKGDSFHLVFENNRQLEYKIKKAAATANNADYKQISFAMLPQDIQLFASENLIGIRFVFQNGDAPLELKRMNELASHTFKLYFQEYIKALGECGVQIDSHGYEEESLRDCHKETNSLKESSCFVYLMKDETNGYYKIGISNKPEYREKTLQSEKPTIVLLSAKEYPTRIIAEAIESALHKAFESKRIRGEWFELDEKDVREIKMTLI